MTLAASITTLITLLCGLMLADLLTSLHRLIRHRERVRWHWLPLAVAWYMLLVILKNWWGIVFVEEGTTWSSGWGFFYYGHLLFLFYLAVSAVLPDEVPDEGLDLRVFYLGNRRHFWGLLSCVNGLLLGVTLLRSLLTDAPFYVLSISVNTAVLAVSLSLIRVRSLGYHAAVVVLMGAFVVLEIWSSF